MKSFLAGEAEIRLGLNEDLIVGSEEKRHGLGSVVLDDANFHESANLDLFDQERIVSIIAPDGEVGVELLWVWFDLCTLLFCSLR